MLVFLFCFCSTVSELSWIGPTALFLSLQFFFNSSLPLFLHILLLLSSSSIAFLLKVLFVFSFLQLWASCVCNLNVSAWLLSHLYFGLPFVSAWDVLVWFPRRIYKYGGAMFAIFISRNGCLSLLLKHLTAFVFPPLSKNCCASVCKDCSALFLVGSLLSVWNQDRPGTECPCCSWNAIGQRKHSLQRGRQQSLLSPCEVL